MQDEDDILNELEASSGNAKTDSQLNDDSSPQPKKTTSKLNINRRQRGMFAMGGVVILGLVVIFGPGLFSSNSQHHKTLQPVEQQEATDLQPVVIAKEPLAVAQPMESDVQKELDGVHSQLNDLKSLNEAQLSLLHQLLLQNQNNVQSLINEMEKKSDASQQSNTLAVGHAVKAGMAKKNRLALHHLPAFSINTIYPNEAWLRLGSLTYVVRPGDEISNVRIIAIDAENHLVTTSAGDIH